jgi:tetratricopeptide (TPR) repeat protein
MTAPEPDPQLENASTATLPQARGALLSKARWWALGATFLVMLAAIGAGWWYHDRPERRFIRGWEAFERGDAITAFQESRALLSSEAFQPHAHLLAGALLLRSGKPAEALAELSLANGHADTSLKALVLAAEGYYALSRFGEAAQAARGALEREPDSIDARRWLALAYYDLGAGQMAAEQLQVLAQADPADAGPHRMLGLIEKDRTAFVAAIEAYQEALRRQPDHPQREEILVEMAESMVKIRRFDEALEALSQCPSTSETLVLAAQCHAGLGNDEGERQALEQAMELSRDDLAVLLARANYLSRHEQHAQAAAILEKAVALYPNDGTAHYQLGQAYERLDESQKAARQFELQKKVQALEKEFSELHHSVTIDADNPQLRYRLGDLARKLDKPKLAEMWFKAALALDPAHPQARAALRDLKRDEAR